MGLTLMRRTRTATDDSWRGEVVGWRAAGLEAAASLGFVASAVDSYANGLTLPIAWSLVPAAGFAAMAIATIIMALFV